MNEKIGRSLWVHEALDIVWQHQRGEAETVATKERWRNGKCRLVTMFAKRDDWGRSFLDNMESILLALDFRILGEPTRTTVIAFLSMLDDVCHCSTNVQTRSERKVLRAFINHVATPRLSSSEAPDECIKVFGEALQHFYSFCDAGIDIVENVSRLTERAVMEKNFPTVTKEHKPTRV